MSSRRSATSEPRHGGVRRARKADAADATERVRRRRRESRTARALRLLVACEEGLAAASSPNDLLRVLCRLVVDEGGFRLAAAGCAEREGAPIRRIAHYAPHAELDCLRIAWSSATAAAGPAAVALRTRRAVVSSDLPVPRLEPPSEEPARSGRAAAVALPIAPDDVRPCVLLVVSAERADLDDATLKALRRLANHVAQRLTALRVSAFLAEVVDHAPVPFYVVRRDGCFTLVNRAWERSTGRRRGDVLGRRLEEVFRPDSARLFYDVNARVLASGQAIRAEERALVRGVLRAFDTVKFPVRDAEGRMNGVAGFSVAVTQRRAAEDRLRFQARLLEEISDAVIAIDVEERITYANRAAIERYAPGATIDRVLGRGLREFYEYRWRDPGDAGRAARALETAGTWRGEVTHVRRDGASWPADAAVVALRDPDGRRAGSFAVLRDISERKASEDALRASREELRALALRLQTIREEEKARIARDLHDELGQLVTALKLVMSEIERRLEVYGQGVDGALVDRVVGASELLDRMAASVRRIASELRPGILDELGLAAALEQEAHRFERHSGIACRLRSSPEAPHVPAEVATALYRIAQEALTNVARHAHASTVDIALAVRDGEVTLVVEDDGCGLPAGAGPRCGLGVLGMRERASALGGQVRIESREGAGTRVTACIPAARGQAGGAG